MTRSLLDRIKDALYSGEPVYSKSINVAYTPSVDAVELYKCDDCGKWNNYWTRLCYNCDMKQDAEVDERMQEGL